MTIATLRNTCSRTLLTLSVISLIACGGGGGGGDKTPPPPPKTDSTPDTFTFTPQNDAQITQEYSSNIITITGIDIAAPISITGGMYSVNGGAFTAAAGTVSATNTVMVKTTSSNITETTQSAVLTIGGVNGTYSVTTMLDKTPPVAEFKFPTPYTMSEAMSVKVRGTATDDHAITSVKVVVRSFTLDAPTVTLSTHEIEATPKAAGDFSSWTVDVPLTALAENEIKVVAMDDRNNTIQLSDANKVVIRQAPIASAFPNQDNPIRGTSGMLIDRYEGRNRLLIAASSGAVIYSISIDTGEREVYKNYRGPGISSLRGMIIDASIEIPVFYVAEEITGTIFEVNLASGEILKSYSSTALMRPKNLVLDDRNGVKSLVSINAGEYGRDSNVIALNLQTELFSVISSDDNYPLIPSTWGFALDKARDRYLVTVKNSDIDLYGIYSISRTTGERKAFSTNEIGAGDLFADATQLQDIAVDKETLYVVGYYPAAKLFAIDLNTGHRRVASDLSFADVDGEIVSAEMTTLQISSPEQYAFVSGYGRNSLRVVDLTNGEKVFLSKAKENY